MSDSESTIPESPYLKGTLFRLYACPAPEFPARSPHEEGVVQDSQWCLSTAQQRYPPVLSNNDSDVQIELVQLLAVQSPDEEESLRPDGLWVVNTNTVGLPSKLVAKFSDPVYHFSECWHRKKDAFYFADESAANESWSYEAMKELQGKTVPRFYGHYLANLPFPQLRTVSILLVEWVDGMDLATMTSWNTVCDRHRQTFAEEAYRICQSIVQCGVAQKDIASRNVMLRNSKSPSEPCKDGEDCPFGDGEDFLGNLVMIDFEDVRISLPPTFNYEHYRKYACTKCWGMLRRTVH